MNALGITTSFKMQHLGDHTVYTLYYENPNRNIIGNFYSIEDLYKKASIFEKGLI